MPPNTNETICVKAVCRQHTKALRHPAIFFATRAASECILLNPIFPNTCMESRQPARRHLNVDQRLGLGDGSPLTVSRANQTTNGAGNADVEATLRWQQNANRGGVASQCPIYRRGAATICSSYI